MKSGKYNLAKQDLVLFDKCITSLVKTFSVWAICHIGIMVRIRLFALIRKPMNAVITYASTRNFIHLVFKA